MTGRTDRDRVPALRQVLVCGALFAAASAVTGGGRAVVSCAAGVALAVTNLWLLSRTVGAFVGRGGGAGWGLAAAMKALLLYGAVVVMVMGGLVDMVPLLVGLGALPAGIVAHALLDRGDLV